MAGGSGKDQEAGQRTGKRETVWRAGIYARLSVDKDDRKNESIDTQLQIAREFIHKADGIEYLDSYIDLGKTGTNFEREGFARMMADVRRHKINCIIVKDLSRFGRNYIETGNYIEKIFPFFHVRFIAVTDGFDSHRSHGTNDALAVNLKNIVNELYARDCAEKVRIIKKSRLEQGCYVGGIPAYGYGGKWINGKKILFPEEGASDVVRKIFELFDRGSRISEIISYLYEQRVHRPKEYQSCGHVYCEEGELLKQWSDTTVKSMLTNQVYIGTLIQNRADGKICRSRGRHEMEPDEVITVEHAHEPIVEEDLFYRVSSKIEAKRKAALQREKQPEAAAAADIYKGLLYCGECGRRLKRTCASRRGANPGPVRTCYYGCPDAGRIDGLKCDTQYLSWKTLDGIVSETLRKEFERSGTGAKPFGDYNRKQTERAKKRVEKKERDLQAHLQKLNMEVSAFYMQYKEGKIDREMFLRAKEEKERQKKSREQELLRLQTEKTRIGKETDAVDHLLQHLREEKEWTVSEEQIIPFFIHRIRVYRDRRVELIFNFRNNYGDAEEPLADEG